MKTNLIFLLLSLLLSSCSKASATGGKTLEKYNEDIPIFAIWFNPSKNIRAGTVFLSVQWTSSNGVYHRDDTIWFDANDMEYVLSSTNFSDEWKARILLRYNEAVRDSK